MLLHVLVIVVLKFKFQVGIEGNTMTVEQLRYVLETGQVVSGKSLLEHNEILGLEKAMQYVKLLIRTDYIGIKEILGIHRRVMGHVDPIKSGVFRDEKVRKLNLLKAIVGLCRCL